MFLTGEYIHNFEGSKFDIMTELGGLLSKHDSYDFKEQIVQELEYSLTKYTT